MNGILSIRGKFLSLLYKLAIMKHYSEIITKEPNIRFGKPCIRGLRITVYDILGWLASGMTTKEIINDFPELNEDDVQACLIYAAEREHKIRIAS